jgi:hypothetical protein
LANNNISPTITITDHHQPHEPTIIKTKKSPTKNNQNQTSLTITNQKQPSANINITKKNKHDQSKPNTTYQNQASSSNVYHHKSFPTKIKGNHPIT